MVADQQGTTFGTGKGGHAIGFAWHQQPVGHWITDAGEKLIAESSGQIENAFGIGHERAETIFDRWVSPGQMAVEAGETERKSGGVKESTS